MDFINKIFYLQKDKKILFNQIYQTLSKNQHLSVLNENEKNVFNYS